MFIPGTICSGRTAFRKARQRLIDVGPGDRPFRPCLASGLDQLRLIQRACLEEDRIGKLLGPGEQGRTAIRTELAHDLLATIGGAGIAFDLTGEDPQFAARTRTPTV